MSPCATATFFSQHVFSLVGLSFLPVSAYAYVAAATPQIHLSPGGEMSVILRRRGPKPEPVAGASIVDAVIYLDLDLYDTHAAVMHLQMNRRNLYGYP